jgi:glycosyltransferase involved in cell wall biosynthesis
MINTPAIALFIPTFRVAGTVESVLRSIPESTLARLKGVIIIDNCSDDGTRVLLQSFLQKDGSGKFHLFLNDSNYSLGGSTILAFRIAKSWGCDFMICMHSDGQASANDLSRMIDESKPGVDFVFGSRLMPGSNVSEYSALRFFGNRFFAWLQSLVLRCDLKDIGAFISFNLRTVFSLPFDRLPFDMGYHPILVLTAFRSRLKITYAEIPIQWGKVETTNVQIWSYGLKHLWRVLSILLGRIPFKNTPPDFFKTREWIPAKAAVTEQV